ncbi:GNAT family N-acetyltransferase [Roseibium sp.]|uniref:GNAT family N-acetyltransferase n=1 Tax=Roseibium sp. TaxID=1936156 RepID=UPI003B50F9F1
MSDIILETERLRLQPFVEADLPFLLEQHSDPEVNRYHSPGPRPMTTDEVKTRLFEFIERDDGSGFGRRKLTTHDGDYIGRAGIDWMSDPDGYELAYSLKRSAWGKGYASEIAGALTRWFFETTDNGFLIAYAHADHQASQHVMKKTGFRHWFDRDKHDVPCAFYRIERSDVA